MRSESQALLITNGRVIDPASALDARVDLLIVDGRIARVGPGLTHPAARVIDAAGALVVPGLVDLHTHAYWSGALLGVNPDKIGPRSGVTTWVDCGTSGAATFEGFYHHVIRPSRVRILPFINLSYIGLTTAGNLSVDVGELSDWRFADLGELKRVGRQFADQIVGIKLRASNNACGDNAAIVLPLAREAADMLGVPLMIHVGTAPPTIDEVMPFLHEGDILTHIYNPSVGGCVLDSSGRLRASVRDAQRRGVRMDVGHGGSSFSFRVAERAINEGLLPDAISTDLHAHNIDGPVFDLPSVMAKFIALGMSLHEVLRLTTMSPAAVVRRSDLGTLTVGAEADVALFELVEEQRDLADSLGETRQSHFTLHNVLTICRGAVISAVEDDRREGRTYR